MGMLMQYDLATNFDESLIDFIVENDKKKQIKSVFGKLKTDMTGGGRAAFLLPEISMEQLKNYVKKCHDAGIEFNYLINALTLNDAMFDPKKNAELAAFLDELYAIGIRCFTVNSPLLCKYIKTHYSDTQVTVGFYSFPSSIQMIQLWVNAGADEITLDHSFNRDIPLLRATLTAFKDTNVKLRLIANNFCLHGCNSKIEHGCNLACQSTTNPSENPADYILINCLYNKVSKPAAMISSDWIRPEDVKQYVKLMEETGNSNLTLKLVERTRTTDFLKRVAAAYLNESFDGNLLDILNWSKRDELVFVREERPADSDLPKAVGRTEGPFNGETMMKFGRCMRFPDIKIDNKKLDGFMDYFFKAADCRNKLCGAHLIPEDSKNSAICNYCNNWAKKAVTRDEKGVAAWIQDAEQVIKDIETREVYNKNFKFDK